MIGFLVIVVICVILGPVIASVKTHFKLTIDYYLDIKNWSCKKLLIGKLILACEHEVLNTTVTSLDDKKIIYENNCPMIDYFIGNYILIIVNSCFYWLLLLLHEILEKTKISIIISPYL